MMKPLFVRFREAIADHHDAAEQYGPLHRIVDEDVSRDEYESMLKRLYGFLITSETMALEALQASLSPMELARLQRLPDLRTDLRYFGVDDQGLENIPSHPKDIDLADPGKALGWLYLSEGSRLGGAILARHIEKKLGFSDGSGASYFGSRGKNITDQWRWFQELAERELATADERRVSIETARFCFQQLNAWLAS